LYRLRGRIEAENSARIRAAEETKLQEKIAEVCQVPCFFFNGPRASLCDPATRHAATHMLP
jgi:hypothetical protein